MGFSVNYFYLPLSRPHYSAKYCQRLDICHSLLLNFPSNLYVALNANALDYLAPICELEIETNADYTVGLSNPEKFSKAQTIRSIEIKANLGRSERFAASAVLPCST